MAGGLNLKFVPSCPEHGTPCYIKTGTRDGPSKGKSFFICGNQKAQCSFVKPAVGISASHCPHHQTMNDLHALCRKEDELRFYYRCTEGKKQKFSWCGYERLQLKHSVGRSLGDISNLINEKMNRKLTSASIPDKEKVTKNPSNFAVPINGKENHGQDRRDVMVALDDQSTIVKRKEIAKTLNDLQKPKSNNDMIDLTTDSTNNIVTQSSALPISDKEVVSIDKNEPSDAIGKENSQMKLAAQQMMEKKTIEKEIAARKSILRSVSRDHLPDGGRKIMDQIRDLEEMLKDLQAQRNIKNSGDLSIWSTYSDSDLQPSKEEEIAASKDRIGLNLNFNLPSAERPGALPLHYTNPERLYDGRMTHSKLQQVGRVTRDAIEALHRSLETCPTSTTEREDPVGLNVSLMTHQRQALAWLLWREKQKPSGGILADDMGLGKTLTSISLIMKDKQMGFQKKETIPSDMRDSSGTLVVCPASLVHQWRTEIEKRVKPLNLTVCLYHGPTREKNLERLARYDVVLTSYSIVAIETKSLVKSEELKKKAKDPWLTTESAPDVKERRKTRDSLICQIHWRRIILDEAHNIKNHKCMTSIATCYIEAESRWALTGTPIQNDTMDLYAIIKFLRCSPFNELKVWKRWVDDKSSRGTARMNTLVKSLLLRRTKEQTDAGGKPLVALPTRQGLVHQITLTGNEKEIYSLLHAYSKNMLRAFLHEKANPSASHSGNLNPSKSEDSQIDLNEMILGKHAKDLLEMFGLLDRQVNAGAILLMVLRLRQCCSHLSLLSEVLDEDERKEEGIDIPIEDQMMSLSLCESDLDQSWDPVEFKSSFVSTKIRHLLTELEKLNVDSSHQRPIKSVIVSQWTKMLDIVAFHLRKRGVKFDFITGKVSIKKRNEIVEDFNANPRGTQVMLVSLRAGGVGLNLIGGSHLFLLDQHWNPALENQASDRIYRVGQKNNVCIHRFLCTETIEEKITALQDKKRAIADTVLKGGKQASQKLTLEDLRTLFGV